jgi:hypothetical protein
VAEAGGNPAVLQVALAEFSALRSEIKDRSSYAWALVNLDITATAALFGFVLSKSADPKLLLALPLLAPALGLLFLDHAYNINNLGSYIGKRLRPIVLEAAGSADLLGYEEAMDRYEEHRFLRLVPLGLPITLLFSALPAGALIFVVPSLDAAWAWVVWAFGLLLVLVQTTLWLTFMLNPGRLDPLKAT